MICVSKFQRGNGYWYVRYWIGGRAVDESARTKSESAAETYRLRRELEINAGIQPIKHADLGELIDLCVVALPVLAENGVRPGWKASRALTRGCEVIVLRTCVTNSSGFGAFSRAGAEPLRSAKCARR